MVEFGKELVMESYRIPLLIWIQLLVTILLFLLLFIGFSVFTSDGSGSGVGSASAGGDAAPPTRLDSSTPPDGIATEEEHRTATDAGASREENRSGEGSSEKDSTFWIIFRQPTHPCNYIRLAKQALFKCFGLDSSSGNCQHEKCE